MLAKHCANTLLPTGTVTFLFTDIEGSTLLWESHPEAMEVALARHDALVRKAIVDANGYVFKTVGDAFCAAFALASDAVSAVLAAQLAVIAEPWPEATPIRVRMALHTGAVESRDGDYFGPPVNRVARLLATGHGGQTLLSHATHELCRDALPDAISLRDLGAHRLKDLARPEQVYELRSPGLRRDFPPIKSLSTHPNNLPQQLTTFIGREKEIAEIEAQLTKTRLVTLTGSGGSGKTRLALQVAAEALALFPDGAWFVELAPLTDQSLVPQMLATVLGLSEEPGQSITQVLALHLKSKRLLLLLDNCEHLRDACATVADALVRQCPGVRILASSREALGILGEQTYRVPSLSLPDRTQTHIQTPQTLSTYEAVQLFIDRALLLRADFAVTNRNAPALASLCCHLDGIPLAIELAAARVRTLSVEEIDSKLDERFRLLTGGSRTALPRHQTLRALIDWSYDLLRAPERLLLQRLSVFAGGWTLAAAEQVCGGAEVANGEVLDLLTSIADKSLVVAEQTAGHSRYGMLETVRQYAQELLAENDGSEAVRERHRDHFLALVAESEPKVVGAAQAQWLRRLEAEHDNLRVAVEWCIAAQGTEAGLQLCAALQRHLLGGHIAEGREWCARALGKAGGASPTLERAKALTVAGTLADAQGDWPAARVLHEEALAIKRELGDRMGIAISLNGLGSVAYAQGDLLCAEARFEECLAILKELGNRRLVATALSNLGSMANHRGDFATARARFEESLGIARELQDAQGTSLALYNLGALNNDLGDHAPAAAQYRESLMIRQELGDRIGIAFSMEGLGNLVGALGGALRAACIWSAADRLREEIGSPQAPDNRADSISRRTIVRAALGDDVAFDCAWQEGRDMTLEQAIEFALHEKVERV